MELAIYQPLESAVLWRVSSFGRQRVPAGQRYWWVNGPRQPVGRVVLQATLAGAIRYEDPRESQQVQPGDLMLFAYGEQTAYGHPHGNIPENYACHWVCLEGVGLQAHVDALRQRHGSVMQLGLRHPLLAELEELMTLGEPGSGTPSTTTAARVHGFIMRLFAEAEQRRTMQLSPVQRAVDFLINEPCQVLSLEAVAQEHGCSREHLSRLFHQQVGQTPHTYLNAAKTHRSLRLLRHTDLPLSEVAAQAGFPSIKTMRRHIQRATGKTPSQVRE